MNDSIKIPVPLVLTLCPVIIAMTLSLANTDSAVSRGGENIVRCVLRLDWTEKRELIKINGYRYTKFS